MENNAPRGLPSPFHGPPKLFLVIDPYQFDGDVAFGIWCEGEQGWWLGDGDLYKPENVHAIWGEAAQELTWSQLETRLRRPV